uniref:Uncharacterized protein n=2 Tax=Timema TaxID=61471 RepID=A0A7R9ALS3_TIMSH|nr:unnamed protein product [Timema shepardi]CAD7574200.1 unnamed protein product [Timema californicum]
MEKYAVLKWTHNFEGKYPHTACYISHAVSDGSFILLKPRSHAAVDTVATIDSNTLKILKH